MTTEQKLERALLVELDDRFRDPKPQGREVRVQFNPETLKVSFANQVTQPQSPGDQSGPSTRQYVGSGTTKLALQLWLDVTAPLPESESRRVDVRELTAQVAYFITPQERSERARGGRGASRTVLVPPPLRFKWGTFQFDGIVDSLDESLEFWSPDGRPLRASLSLSLSQQRIQFQFDEKALEAARAAAAPAPGTAPLTPAPEGASVQSMADRSGQGDDWPAIAAANGIENPRRLAPGQLVDLRARPDLRAPGL